MSALSFCIHLIQVQINLLHSAGLTSGVDGGRGGRIEISVDEDSTHLLFAVQWDISGGRGGDPGHHSEPGLGGHGGYGGSGHQW